MSKNAAATAPNLKRAQMSHTLHQHHVDADGFESRHAMFTNTCSAQEALKSRVQRLRANGNKFTRDGNTVTYVDANQVTITLRWDEGDTK